MNDLIPDEASVSESRPARAGSGPAWLAFLLALLTALGLAWLVWQDYFGQGEETAAQEARFAQQAQQLAGLQSEIKKLEADLATINATDTAARLKSVEQGLSAQKAESSQLQAFRDETAAWTRSMQAAVEGDQARIAGAEARLAALSVRNMNAAAELDLAEIDYVLRLAQERLVLFGDTRTAGQALQIAGQQLAAFDNPLYVGLQNEIAVARQKLLAVVEPDYGLIYSGLDAMQEGLSSLPFKGEGRIDDAASGTAEDGWWARIKGAFSGLVTVKRNDELENTPMVLADRSLVLQRAWMELELARLAAMRRDADSWTSALERFSQQLDRWFDPGSPSVEAMAEQANELQQREIAPVLPDISGPWTALQVIRSAGLSTPASQSLTRLPAASEPEVGNSSDTETDASNEGEDTAE